jgi:tRNA-Thr(GGU) m(6)t(6)A37 methyltransferase TsaA
MHPIGHVRGGRVEARDDGWAQEVATIELTAAFSADALAGLEDFSHVEIVFLFHNVTDDQIERGARHPRGNTDWPKVGIFAQRGKNRPNRIGVSVARIVRRDGTKLTVAGLDAIDGTPVLDIKPVMAEFLPRGEVRQPAWSHELMRHYWR